MQTDIMRATCVAVESGAPCMASSEQSEDDVLASAFESASQEVLFLFSFEQKGSRMMSSEEEECEEEDDDDALASASGRVSQTPGPVSCTLPWAASPVLPPYITSFGGCMWGVCACTNALQMLTCMPKS